MSERLRRTATGAVAIAAVAAGGAAIGNAATSHSTTTTTTTSSGAASPTPAIPRHGTTAHEGSEKAVTGDAAAKAQAAAVKAAGGGTAGNVTTDFTGSGYEVTVTKPDGSTVELHLDSSFSMKQGPGGPAHGSAAHEGSEKAVTGDAAAKAQAAAVKAAGGGTAGNVTTDFTGSGYEVTVTKPDGSTVELRLDSSFAVMQGPGGYGH